jgi:hypothetical protein
VFIVVPVCGFTGPYHYLCLSVVSRGLSVVVGCLWFHKAYLYLSPDSGFTGLIYLQVTVAASPPFGGTQIDHLQLNSQVNLTTGVKVCGGYEKLGTLQNIISSPHNHFTVLEHVKII